MLSDLAKSMWMKQLKVSGARLPQSCKEYSHSMRKAYVLLGVLFFAASCAAFVSFTYTYSVSGAGEAIKLSTGLLFPYLLVLNSQSTTDNDLAPFSQRPSLEDPTPDPTPAPALQDAGRAPGCDAAHAELKVFMYDLPPKFHYGMMAGYEPEEGQVWPANASQIPSYPGGLYKQHSPEYWLTTDVLTSAMVGRSAACTAFRVFDWQAADVIFVPFFASLSYNKYGKRLEHKDGRSSRGELGFGARDRNEELQSELVAFLERQPAWAASGGTDHVVVIHHPNSMQLMRERLRSAMFVVSDFGRYGGEGANVRKDVVAPYQHVIPTFAHDTSAFASRPTLLFFQGAIVRKEGGRIRQELHSLLENHPGVHFTTGSTATEGFQSATHGMRSSKFCLNLAGDTPSSNRLFDSIVSHCVPVIISDDIELPFEDHLDYSSFCIFVEASQALQPGFLLNLLRNVTSEDWTRLWKQLLLVERHFEYQHPTLPDDAVNMVWKAIARRLPAVKFNLHRNRRFTSKPTWPAKIVARLAT